VFEEFGDALAFGHRLDGETVCRHHGTVVVLMGNKLFAPRVW
jgi:hypothetical protein